MQVFAGRRRSIRQARRLMAALCMSTRELPRPALHAIAYTCALSGALLLGACGDDPAGDELAQPPSPPGHVARDPGSQVEPEVLHVQLPLLPMTLYLTAVQPFKAQPDSQVEAHQYCAEVDAQLWQCIVFDRPAADARLLGTRYIASPLLYESLPAEERALWHPLNYEILSGLLAAPQLADAAELSLMERLLNHYAQSWYLPEAEDSVHPPPRMAWSFNRNGEADPELLRRYAEATGIDFSERARRRAALVARAEPQVGVDALAAHDFGRQTRPLEGVAERDDASTTSGQRRENGDESDSRRQ
ncbi:MAG: DUF1264 domain-containing protein [Sinimarinibacterium flocculans]|uniref:DUF1264 domain-containing protein n=1 Tax=Sinimarinibacterium flocculans TaxID=985250 RepID=UPI003C652CEF